MDIPSLQSERLKLVPLDRTCIEMYMDFYTDKSASEAYGGPKSEAASFTRLLSDIGSWHILDFGVWAIELTKTNEKIGVCGFWQGQGWPIELTWWILPEFRKKGYAKEASQLAINCAYEQWNWPSVNTYMNDNNEAAKKLALALNARLVERKIFPDDVSRNYYIFPQKNLS